MATKTKAAEIEVREEWDPTRIPLRCWLCQGRHTILVKILDSGATSKSRIGACETPECPRYTRVGQLETWVRE